MVEIVGNPRTNQAAVAQRLGEIIRAALSFCAGVTDKGIDKIFRKIHRARKSQQNRPTEIKREAKGFFARHPAQFFGYGFLHILVFPAEKRVDADIQRVGKLRQHLGVGCTAAFPLGYRLRCDADDISQLLLRIFLLYTVFFYLLSDNAHSKPSVDL